MTYWQYLIKVGRKKEDRKKIEKYFKSSCLRELKMLSFHTLYEPAYYIEDCRISGFGTRILSYYSRREKKT